MSMRKAIAQEPTGTMYEEQERQKLLRQNRDVRDTQEPRLEWIYTGDRPQSEEYLLGKKYDGDKDASSLPNDNEFVTSTVDLANKIREDPLYLIKKKEIEERKRILENPIRLKQLKELLERQEERSSSSRKKKGHARSRSRSRSRSRDRDRNRNRDRDQDRDRYRHHHRYQQDRRSSPIRDRPKRERTPPSRSAKPAAKQSKEDRERRLQEMMSDGARRTEQRQANVRSLKERDERREKNDEILRQKARKRNEDSSSEDETQDFLRPMMKQVIDDPSLKRRDLKHRKH